MRYDCILFDLDGTLLDSREGVWRSFEYALEQLGHPEPIITNPAPIIGPPIEEVLGDHFGFGPEDVVRGYAYYQEAYVEKGLMYGDPFFMEQRKPLPGCLTWAAQWGSVPTKGKKCPGHCGKRRDWPDGRGCLWLCPRKGAQCEVGHY